MIAFLGSTIYIDPGSHSCMPADLVCQSSALVSKWQGASVRQAAPAFMAPLPGPVVCMECFTTRLTSPVCILRSVGRCIDTVSAYVSCRSVFWACISQQLSVSCCHRGTQKCVHDVGLPQTGGSKTHVVASRGRARINHILPTAL